MSAKFYQKQVTLTNGNVFNTKFYIADPMDFCVEPAPTDTSISWANAGAFGTNASFFMQQSSGKGFMTALHIFRNKNMAEYSGNAEGGNQNCAEVGNDQTAMDIIYCNGTTKKAGLLEKTAEWTPSNNHGVSNMEWGIGGINVLPTNTYVNESTFLAINCTSIASPSSIPNICVLKYYVNIFTDFSQFYSFNFDFYLYIREQSPNSPNKRKARSSHLNDQAQNHFSFNCPNCLTPAIPMAANAHINGVAIGRSIFTSAWAEYASTAAYRASRQGFFFQFLAIARRVPMINTRYPARPMGPIVAK